MPETLAPSVSALTTIQPIHGSPSNWLVVADHTWDRLRGSLRVLTKSSTMFGSLKLAMEDLAQCITIYEDAAWARQDYETLKLELEALSSTLSTHFAGEVHPTMTAGMDNICSAIEKELDLTSTEDRGTGGRHWAAKKDLDAVVECYRRIWGHLDRMTLNADLSTWKIVDELTILSHGYPLIKVLRVTKPM